MLFFNFMILGTLIAISASSWLITWIGLEINLLSIMPLLKSSKNKYPAESAIKYFMVQTLGSSFFLFSVMILVLLNIPMKSEFYSYEAMLVSSALLLKMGAAPMHFWLPEILSGLSWMNTFIILTWQKIAPCMLLFSLVDENVMFFSIIIIISSMISGIQGLNQTCLRKILAYSSINHMGWMICTLFSSINLWIYYFVIYFFINMNMILIFKKYNTFYVNQLAYIFSHSKKIKIIFMLNFLSLGGLPPFMGFLPKWLTIFTMIENEHYTTIVFLVIFTLLSLYFYLRITFSSFSINNEESLLILFKKMSFFHFFLNTISILGLISCSFIDSGF
uniref:NADH-ubiquinone oxidoreductase chain 2 n=1 Tax=Hypera striata TaxID=1342020 RepID=A0A343C4T8_9CUCU|nr:NADH dehydrogenase subunit 2 [Hypera striata]